ncbi:MULTISPECIES: hypothetical protein [Streptomyces]|jgi:hypothetical protein|uniref:Secreted protein n=1 Tax=Streptomyces bottropensis TaxID=42235 RepID=A0ABU8APF3_9ACTN|nr:MULTISPECIES: hypothetical protein [Streptomyces]MZD21873.1 hypothetical protein [Streptomyces sp. SID5476]
MTTVLVLVLSLLVLLAVGGGICVHWTARGDAPLWARGVAGATDVLSELVLKANKTSSDRNGDGDD